MKRIEIEYTLCSGCRLCEIACSLNKEGIVWPETSRLKVHQFHEGLVEVPVLCAQCGDCPAAEACPPKQSAISRDGDTQALRIDPEKCRGDKCGLCIPSCRYQSAITLHPKTNICLVCDLCDGDPECVKVCPTGALLYHEVVMDGRHTAQPVESIAASIATRFKEKGVD